MGEEFEAGICGGNTTNNNYWWSNNNNNNMMMTMNSTTTRSVFPLTMSSSPCSVLTANNDLSGGGMISYSSWQTDTVDLKAPAVAGTATATSCSDISLGFLDASTTTAAATKPLLQNHLHHHHPDEADNNNNHHHNGSILMDSSSLDLIMAWNNSLFGNSSTQSQDQKREMSTKNQYLCGGGNNNFSIGSYDINNCSSSSSTLIQSLYDINNNPQPQQSLFTSPPSNSMAYSSSTPNNYGAIPYSTTTDQFTTTTSASSSSSSSSWSRPSNGGGLHFSNCTPFWNASAEAPHHVFAPSLISEKPNFTSSIIPKPKREEASDSAKKSSCEPAIKKQRIETPSPLPTFKVRKEKLGDRITALQQLVSPFGKTDTASVLHEAIEYIKFLHDQVLSTPYMKNGVPIQHCQQGCDVKELSEGPKQDLRSRGLCLVPISSTFPVTNETPVDFWTPSFGGTLIR
ncbi:hypothetical protein QN277_009453 [Acacia crassicarpa]|uniref:BHLH domain-containing protein n=1 Tax=Acacia crassicarpa TaxID=499986 RepID=A0AAE1M5H2_9FABA|nr:hypothetical protein QN277_009453 [Acacia crassicarpa]